MLTAEYLVKESTGKVHMVYGTKAGVTLCGQTSEGYLGDETASGFSATCKTCKRVFARDIGRYERGEITR